MKNKKIIINEGEKISYEILMNEAGCFLAENIPYNKNEKKEFLPGDGIDGEDAYFEADADYELIIRKKRAK